MKKMISRPLKMIVATFLVLCLTLMGGYQAQAADIYYMFVQNAPGGTYDKISHELHLQNVQTSYFCESLDTWFSNFNVEQFPKKLASFFEDATENVVVEYVRDSLKTTSVMAYDVKNGEFFQSVLQLDDMKLDPNSNEVTFTVVGNPELPEIFTNFSLTPSPVIKNIICKGCDEFRMERAQMAQRRSLPNLLAGIFSNHS